MNDSLQIKCPHCGNKFSPEAALEHDVRQHVEKEFELKLAASSKAVEERTKKIEEEKYQTKIRSLEAERQDKSKRLLELEKKSVLVEEREQLMKGREEQFEMEMRKRLLEREKLLKAEAEVKAYDRAQLEVQEKLQQLSKEKEVMDITMRKRVLLETEKARDEERMKMADMQKQLDDQIRLVNEMKRKSDQGSMQAQGEVQELAIENYLASTFLRDEIEEIGKGKRGGDCVHHVKDAYGNRCGKILYESKRTKNFGADWTAKLKEDARLIQADLGVIVTEVLPGEMTRFGLYDGVWVCTFAEFKALSVLLRDSICRIGEVRAAQENKGDKMQLLYDYLTSTEFRQKIEVIVEAFQQMQDDLNKEKAQAMSHWAKRDKQILRVMESTASLYGDVRGIAGTAIKEIRSLEIEALI